MSSLSLQERLAILRTNNTPIPLWVFLYIYSKAERECYTNYMAGAKILLAWLTDDGKIPLDFQEKKYPEIGNKNFKVPSLLRGYESLELSKILTAHIPDFNIRLKAMSKADRAIYFAMTKRVLQELY